MSGTSGSALQWLRLENNGTSDIFFSCLTTILICTFMVLHLNVPPPYSESTSVFFLNRWWDTRIARQLRRQLCWAAMVVVAPELLVSLAFGSWRAASLGLGAFRNHGRKNVKDWTWGHASFANMGGLKFEMQRGGQEIPAWAPFRERGIGEIGQVKVETVEHATLQDIAAVFHRIRKKLKQWWQSVSSWITALFRPITKIFWGTSNKGKGRAPAREPEIPRPETSAEMIALDRSDMRLRSGPTHEHRHNGGRGESHAGPSTARPPSVDLGQVTASSRDEQDEQDEQENLEQEDATRLLQNNTIILYLNAAQIVAAQLLGILDEGPHLSKEDIEDKSKATVIAKSFAVLQLLWFAMRVVIQLCRSQPITQLELATCTYVLCALISYALFWSKPQGVERPIEHSVPLSHTVRTVTDEDIRELRRFGGTPFLTRNFIPPFGMDQYQPEPTRPIPTDISLAIFAFLGPRGVALFDDDFAGILVGMAFGAIYCLGWNQTFPSLWEKWAWRGASVLITGSLIPYSVANGVCTNAFGHLRGKTHIVPCLVLYTFLGVYISCRVFMLVEMVRTLFV